MLNEINVITIFPEIINEWKKYGIVSQGIKKNLVTVNVYDLRKWGIGEYRQVDDAPYGGGPGMVMMVEPLDKVLENIDSDKNIFLMPSGEEFTEDVSLEMTELSSVTIVCGRYEGFDKRIIEMHSDYEISIGKTVVSGGEVPSLFVMESCFRK